jgi:tryptophan-rich sensory protein
LQAQQNFTQWIGLVASILICFAAAGIGSLFTIPATAGWYATLNKHSWNPPNRIFGPVWSTLYLLMGISAWLIWRERGFKGAAFALTFFALQLALNALWSYLFFGLHNPGLALIEIIFLWIAILATLIAFSRLNTIAGALLLPYILWVTFAAFLNYTIWKLNS